MQLCLPLLIPPWKMSFCDKAKSLSWIDNSSLNLVNSNPTKKCIQLKFNVITIKNMIWCHWNGLLNHNWVTFSIIALVLLICYSRIIPCPKFHNSMPRFILSHPEKLTKINFVFFWIGNRPVVLDLFGFLLWLKRDENARPIPFFVNDLLVKITVQTSFHEVTLTGL